VGNGERSWSEHPKSAIVRRARLARVLNRRTRHRRLECLVSILAVFSLLARVAAAIGLWLLAFECRLSISDEAIRRLAERQKE
jgi:hypothetical protein